LNSGIELFVVKNNSEMLLRFKIILDFMERLISEIRFDDSDGLNFGFVLLKHTENKFFGSYNTQ